MSPAAKTSGSLTERRLASTATKPLPSSSSPVSASQPAAPACVAHSASSKPIRRPSAQTATPGSTATTSALS